MEPRWGEGGEGQVPASQEEPCCLCNLRWGRTGCYLSLSLGAHAWVLGGQGLSSVSTAASRVLTMSPSPASRAGGLLLQPAG